MKYSSVIINTSENFRAGKTSIALNEWRKITQDKWILDTVSGYHVQLSSKPFQCTIPKPFQFKETEKQAIQLEIIRFLDQGIIEIADINSEGEYISNIFTRPKADGRIRIILNLKSFNSNYVDKIHFKMETLGSVTTAMRKDCYFGKVDISDAFYTVPICKPDRRYFRFFFEGVKYQFTALVMGFAKSPMIFTKLMKPVFSYLRSQGHVSSIYIDDACLQGQTYSACEHNINETVKLLDKLGFTISISKSVLIPSKSIVFLGFILCSETMTIRLTKEKCDNILELCSRILKCRRITIQQFSQIIGKLVAASPGVTHAPLYIKPLERSKERELKKHKGNFNSFFTLTHDDAEHLKWWIENIHFCYKNITTAEPNVVMYTDSSGRMWGAYDKTGNRRTNGFWSAEEQKQHINVLELKACQVGLQSFFKHYKNLCIKIYMDNTTSVSYINNYGGRIDSLNRIARDIWLWCIERNIGISAHHVCGSLNSTADKLSRSGNEDLEWSLTQDIFTAILRSFPSLNIDLFASRLNAKFPNYVSRIPDPNAYAIDAFSFAWHDNNYYCFPPFSVIGRILQKVEVDQTERLCLVAPVWPAQTWWPTLIQLIVAPCLLLPLPQDILTLCHRPEKKHPLKKMRLALFPISGRRSNLEAFQKKLNRLSSVRGENQPGNNMKHILSNGFITVKGNMIPLTPL